MVNGIRGIYTNAKMIIDRTIDPRGRFITAEEFNILISTFRDRYDPVRLCFSLMFTCGLRSHRATDLRLNDFRNDFKELICEQCKPKKKTKDGVVHLSFRPHMAIIPDWLSEDLRAFMKYRLAVGEYVGGNLESMRLFPKLKRYHLIQWLYHLRIRKGDKYPWLKDLWKVEEHYGEDGTLLYSKPWFRVAIHACKANYVSRCAELVNGNPTQTCILSGHAEPRHMQKYIRMLDLVEKKKEVKERFMDKLTSQQLTPLLKGQKRLDNF